MNSTEYAETMRLLATLSAEDKIRLISFLRALQGSANNSELPPSCLEKVQV